MRRIGWTILLASLLFMLACIPTSAAWSAATEGTHGLDRIVGTNHYDRIIGTDRRDTINARGGSDQIWPKDGRDVIHAGPGHDHIFAYGDFRRDVIYCGRNGFDHDHGDPRDGDDALVDPKDVTHGCENIFHRGGHWHNAASSRLTSSRSSLVSSSTVALATITGTAGADVIVGTSRGDWIRALAGSDRVQGRGGPDDLYGHGGRDKLRGNGGADYVIGGKGRDVVDGGGGYDVCFGGPGLDLFLDCEFKPDYHPRGEAAGGVGLPVVYRITAPRRSASVVPITRTTKTPRSVMSERVAA